MIAAFVYASVLAYSVQASILGQTVTNTASVTYSGKDGQPVIIFTNEASFVVQGQRTESTVEFYRHAPAIDAGQSESLPVKVNGTDYSPSGSLTGPFIAMSAPMKSVVQSKTSSNINAQIPQTHLDTSSPLIMVPAQNYLSGELLFIRVTDKGQNGNDNQIENIVVTLQISSGDAIVLRLYENEANSGEFWGYVQSTVNDVIQYDDELSAARRDRVTVTYIDNFDKTEVSVDTAVMDPFGRVFNSISGSLIDGTEITLIDNQTNQPATVYGVDGLSKFPATIISGTTIYDEANIAYVLSEGEFIFPITPKGDYRLEVKSPTGFNFASALSKNDFETLDNAPFIIDEASYGRDFNHANTGMLNYDIPLDGQTQFVVSKSTSSTIGDVGDSIEYSASVENKGEQSVPVVLRDTMPLGFVYKQGTALRDMSTKIEPSFDNNGRDLIFKLGALASGEKIDINYVLQIGAGVKPGTAINNIVVVDGNNRQVSNIASAQLEIKEDLFRTNSTIMGLVAEEACEGADQWVREIRAGKGVEGVRLYTESGAYATSDKDGLFHFQGVKPGTHVVQLDEATLPRGYTPMVCEENTQYAGSAISKFVEVGGGGIWRANFYLKKTQTIAKREVKQVFHDQLEYKKYDRTWLQTQSSDIDWVYPSINRTPSSPSVNIGIKHGAGQKIKLSINGKAIPSENFAARDSNQDRSVLLSRWRGVDLLEGRNIFTARIHDKKGNLITSMVREIYFVKNIARAVAVPDRSILVANGRNAPELAIRLEDEAGRPVHSGRIVKISVDSPYHLHNTAHFENGRELLAPLAAHSELSVGVDGIVRVTLEPTLKTGKVTANVTLDNGRIVTLSMYLAPEKRDWILVGLAEGSVAHATLSNKKIAMASGQTDGLMRDGRIAFFAKGMVKGNWLMTLAVDTDKRRGERDGDFETQIDPNAYYTLYGDRSYSEVEAASRYPFYIKLEKKQAYALFGDFNTNITEGKLTRYSRNLSGLKAEYLGAKFQAMGYIAETNQGFAKAEIPADGTSGPYVLTNAPVLANSEKITIETRDRTRSDIIISRLTMIRHIDYVLDNYTGEIVFRLPVDVGDSQFNPNVIVVEYETELDSERHVSFGGRVQKNLMRGRVKIGSSFAHEGGSASAQGAKASMVGVDFRARLVEGTELRAEFGHTRNSVQGSDENTKANAYLAEIIHTSDRLTADAYFRQEDGGYGLGQRSSNTGAVRRYGANVSYKIQELNDEKTGRRGQRTINASAYKEDNLSTGNSRLLSEINVTQEGERLSASAGLRHISDKTVGQESRKSLMAILSGRLTLPKYGASLHVSHEQAISTSSNEGYNSDFPTRTRIGLDKSITDKARVHLTHDIISTKTAAGTLKSQNTALGVTFSPWAGTELNASTDMMNSNSSSRIGATFGLDQQFQINDRWSASGGLTSRHILDNQSAFTQIAPDAAVSILETNEKFLSAYAGLGFRADRMSASGRVEARTSSRSDAYVLNLAATREISDHLSFAAAWRTSVRNTEINSLNAEQEADDNAAIKADGNTVSSDARLAMAWRPNDQGLILLNRFDWGYDKLSTGGINTKLVNNFAGNAQLNDRLQMTFNYGLKFTSTELLGQTHSGITQLFGAQGRYDLSQKWDIGLQGSMLMDHKSDTMQYAFGPSVGVSPVKNVWASAGYNLTGYKDPDFMAAEYARHGFYLQFRMKFDQNSAQGLLNYLSP